MAMDSFEASYTKEANRYLIGLPWKKDPYLLPNNYPLAERRLKSLERSLSKNEEKTKMYNRTIEEYIENGCARPLTKEESQSDVKPVYYLPTMVFTDQTNQVLHLELSLISLPRIRESL